jgi:CarD family transcriptional regulator
LTILLKYGLLPDDGLIVSLKKRWKSMVGKSKKTKAKKVTSTKKEFSKGDLAVYPAHGVGYIESIESKEINGDTLNFYMMKIVENGMVIMIPTSNVESVGLREVIPETEVPEVYKVMQAKAQGADNQTWNRRYREYMDKIKTGSIYDVAEVFRDLFQLKLEKDLSFGERKLLDTAQNLLVQELSTAKDIDEKLMMQEIESLFN